MTEPSDRSGGRMKFYIATHFHNREGHAQAKQALEALGHELTFDWTVQMGRFDNPSVLISIAVYEIEAVKEADYVVVILPGRLGTHVELGAALALDKPVILVVGHPENLKDESGFPFPFYSHPLICQVVDIPTAARIASKMDERAQERASV